MNTLEYIQEMKAPDKLGSREDCIDLMLGVRCFELPVVEQKQVIGKVLLEDCLNSQEQTIETMVEPGFPQVYYHSHVFDLLKVMREGGSSLCAVVNKDFEYMGVVTRESVVNALAGSLSTEQPGAVIMIEMSTHQYSSSEIARIVESENAQVLGLWLENVPDSGRIRASIKVNTINAERIISSLIRFNYEVIDTFGDDDYKENVEKRFQALMKYLDI